MSAADSRPARRRYWIVHAWTPLSAGLALLAALELSEFDLRWSDYFFRPELGGWYLKNAWWAEGLLHRGGRAAVVVLAFALLVLAVRPGVRLRAWRRPMLYVLATLAACAVLVGGLKASSSRPCPWDVDRYGGGLAHLGLLDSPPIGARPGRCFPSAHASAGFSLVAFYFGLRDRAPRAAVVALVVALAVGSAFGFAQVARGAHFASHNLASALLCWTVALVLYEWLLAGAVWREVDVTSGGGEGSSPTCRRNSRSAP